MKQYLAFMTALMLSASIAAPAAFARDGVEDDGSVEVHASLSGHQDDSDDDGDHKGFELHGKAHASSTVSDDQDDDNDDNRRGRDHAEDDNASTTNHGNGRDDSGHHGMGELHRSVVAAFVHSLLADADRDGGIGAQVRAVAQSQNDHASSTADAMTKVESRSKLLTFLLGTDWSSLGALKAEIRNTQNDIATLEASLANATDAQVRADLSAQIQVLKDEQARMQAFVDAHESEFSLLGWFTKLFAKSDDNS